MRNEELHDQHTTSSVISFQVAASTAEAANKKLESENNSLTCEIDRLKHSNASLDEQIREKVQAVSILESEEARFDCSRKAVESDFSRQQQQLDSLRRPRQEAEQEKNETAQESFLHVQNLVTSVTNLLNKVVVVGHHAAFEKLKKLKNVENSSFSSSSKSVLFDNNKNIRQEITVLENIIQDLDQEISSTSDFVQIFSSSTLKSKERDLFQIQNKIEEAKNKNEQEKQKLQQLIEKVESYFHQQQEQHQVLLHHQDAAEQQHGDDEENKKMDVTSFSSFEEEIKFLQLQLSSLLPQEHSRIETELRSKRDQLRETSRSIALDLERSEEKVEQVQKEYEMLLDELASMSCTRCGQVQSG
jgi:chromosome segregation ATPase